MKFVNTLKIGAAALSFIATGTVSAQTITPAFEYVSGDTLSDSRPYTLGFSFNLAAAKTVNALGYNTATLSRDQTVGLWSSTGTLLASTVIGTASTTVGNFSWESISALSLAAGDYVLAATYTGGPFPTRLTGVTTAADYTYLTDLQDLGPGLNFPTLSTNGSYGTQGIGVANLSFGMAGAVPEPASWALMIGGMGMVGGALRRRTIAFAA